MTGGLFFFVHPGGADCGNPDQWSQPKRIDILVIAATNQPVYRHSIASHWTELIRHVAANVLHIDVYLLTEHRRTGSLFAHIVDAVIEDPNADVNQQFHEHAELRFPHARGTVGTTGNHRPTG